MKLSPFLFMTVSHNSGVVRVISASLSELNVDDSLCCLQLLCLFNICLLEHCTESCRRFFLLTRRSTVFLCYRVPLCEEFHCTLCLHDSQSTCTSVHVVTAGVTEDTYTCPECSMWSPVTSFVSPTPFHHVSPGVRGTAPFLCLLMHRELPLQGQFLYITESNRYHCSRRFTLYFLPDLFNWTPSLRLWKVSSHTAINAWRLFIHEYTPLSIVR